MWIPQLNDQTHARNSQPTHLILLVNSRAKLEITHHRLHFLAFLFELRIALLPLAEIIFARARLGRHPSKSYGSSLIRHHNHSFRSYRPRIEHISPYSRTVSIWMSKLIYWQGTNERPWFIEACFSKRQERVLLFGVVSAFRWQAHAAYHQASEFGIIDSQRSNGAFGKERQKRFFSIDV